MTQTKSKIWTKDFTLLTQAQMINHLGDILYNVSIGFWVYQKTNSVSLMGLMASIGLLVNMLVNPISGVIVDKLNRKKLMITADLIQGSLILGVGILSLNNHLSVPVILVTAFIVSFISSFYHPSIMTTFVDLVKKEDIVQAQSIFSSINSLLGLIGKGLSGALIVFFGVPTMIILNGLSNLVSAFILKFIKIPHHPVSNEPITYQSIIRDVIEGAKYSIQQPGLNVLMVCAILANLFGAGYGSLYIPMAFQKGLTEIEYGLFMMSATIAALIAAVALGAFKIPSRFRMSVFSVSFILSTLFSIFTFMSTGFIPFTGFNFVAEIFMVMGNTLLSTTILIASPRERRATIFGFLSSFSLAGMAVSTLAYGYLAEIMDLSLISMIGVSISFFMLIPVIINPDIKKFMNTEEDNEPIAA